MEAKSVESEVTEGKSAPIKPKFFEKPDIVDSITIILVVLFCIAVFQNITYLGSSIEYERRLAMQFLAIAVLGGFGIFMKTFFDKIKIRNKQGELIKVGITDSELEIRNIGGLTKTFIFFMIAFGVQATISFFALQALPLSIFDLKFQILVMGIISAVSEELFFSYFLTSLIGRYIKWFVILAVTGVFVYYHYVVYQSYDALLFVGLMRLVYCLIYLYSRRLSSVMLAHILNNVMVGLGL